MDHAKSNPNILIAGFLLPTVKTGLMFQMNAFYHGWGLNRQVRKAKSKSPTLFFWRKVALKPPKQYTKLDTQGFLSYHLSILHHKASEVQVCGSGKCLARNPQK
jgi:hypothetical protein